MRAFMSLLFEDAFHRRELVLYLGIFFLRHRIVDDAAGRLRISVGAGNVDGAERYGERAVSVEAKMSQRTRIGTAPFGLVLVYDLHGLDLWRARHRASRKIGRERGEHVLAATYGAGDLARDVLNVAEFLHAHEVLHSHAPELGDASDVVAM